MINVNNLPCAECQHYRGVKQPDGTEKSEYVSCHIAANKRADNLLKLEGRKFTCDKVLKFDDES